MASEQELDQLLQLDLKSLMNVKVHSASKVEENTSDASASITSYSAKDIQNMAYYNIGDLADITPGYSTHIRFGERVFETRGQRSGSFNNDKHLLMIDGVPIQHARNYKVPTEDELPLYFADKVEFIRGPASSLYGTSAFFGVVDIKSKTVSQPGYRAELRASLGNVDSQGQIMSNIFYNSDFGQSSLNLGYSKKKASKDQVGITNDPNWKNYDDKNNIFIYAKHAFNQGLLNGLSLNTLYSRKESGLGEFWLDSASYPQNNLIWETLVPFIKYERPLNDVVQFSSFIKYNQSREIGDAVNTPAGPVFEIRYESLVQNIETQAELQFNLSDKTNVITGINYDARRERGWPDSTFYNLTAAGFVPVFSEFRDTTKWFQTNSYYSQIRHELDFLKGLIITAGARYDSGRAENQRYNNLSPRISVVQKFSDKLNLRLNYSTSLRAPGIKEIGLNNEGLIRVGGLSPETFTTREASLIYHNKKIFADATVFENKTHDAITAFQTGGENKFKNNNGTTKSVGAELGVKYAMDLGLEVAMNYSYVSSEDTQGLDLSDIPKQKANLILTYHNMFKELPYSVSLINKWVSDYTVSNPALAESGRHNIADINARLDVSDKTALELQVRNLFDNNYRIPNANIEQIFMPGRRAFLSFTRRF